MPTSPKRPILFNLTHLEDNCGHPTPTGIDRVALQQGRAIMAMSTNRPVLYTRQFHNGLEWINPHKAIALIHNLENRWLGHIETLNKPKKPKHPLTRAHKHIKAFLTEKYLPLLDKKLRHALNTLPPPIYLNSSPQGLHHFRIHQELAQHYQADLLFYLHDLIPIDYPEYSASTAEMHHKRLITMANTARCILTNSQYVEARFIRYCQENGLRVPPTSVLHIGIENAYLSPKYRTCQTLPWPYRKRIQKRPYFIMVGTLEPRKNHLLLLQIWRHLGKSLGDRCPMLVLVGKRGWKNQHIVDLIEQSPGLKPHVVEIRDATDQDTIALTRGALAALFPSFEEGWGIPVVEALTLGIPVICSDIPPLREASQGQALYLDPLDGPGWQKAILHRLKQPHPPIHFAPPSWQAHATKLAEIIHQLDGEAATTA